MITDLTYTSKVHTSTLQRSHVRQLLSRLDQKTFSTTAYDTAWVARVKDPSNDRISSYPQLLYWLRRNQHPDGSWGSEIEYYHDRIICTLSALLALAEYGDPIGDRQVIYQGEQYIQKHFDQLAQEPCDTVGFELLLPVLFDQAKRSGLVLPYARCEPYRRIRAEKLGLIPPHMLFSRLISSTHSLEFFGNALNDEQLVGLQEPNGSYGNSPSATAYVLQMCPANVKARNYLNEVLSLGDGSAMSAHPVEVFNKAWVLYNLELSGILCDFIDLARRHLDALWQSWDTRRGIGFARYYPVYDLDDTAVVAKLLHRSGYTVDPDVFLAYEKDEHFACYSFERNPSIGANVHLLDALGVFSGYAHRPRMVKKILQFLRSSRRDGAYWLDKWHISPYYITSHAITALIGFDNGLARDAVHWLLSTQRTDGSWGCYSPTSEETAYCLQALVTYHNMVEKLNTGSIYRAADYLNCQYGIWELPAMWVEKCLYTPVHIVESTILSSLIMSANI